MKTSLNWLRDFLADVPKGDAIADALMRGGLPVESIEQHGDDTVLDVELTSNRSDCLSHVGVAREISALMGVRLLQKEGMVTEVATRADNRTSDVTSVRVDAPQLCPHYTARVIRNVKIGPSPTWMVKRLEAIGVRAINNVVDVTNYVMFELGQPLHAFDFDTLAGRMIIVREAKAGETITSIDGHERKLSPGMLVIADAEKPVAVAGVMGGLNTEVSDATKNVLLETARFDPLTVRRTARGLAMKSDSSYRYERGLDPTLVERASLRAAHLIAGLVGGELAVGVAEAGKGEYTPRDVKMRLERMRMLLGTNITDDEAIEALRRLQLSPRRDSDSIIITVPSWRADLSIEVDVIEEVGRVVGYDRIPVREQIEIEIAPPVAEQRTMERIRETLVGAGFFEAVTFTFVSDALADDFVPAGSAGLPRADAAVRKTDARLRPSVLPGLLEAVRRNEANGTSGAKLFETGSTFTKGAAGAITETRRLALLGDADLRGVRGAVEALLERLDATKSIAVMPDSRAGFAAGACGRIEWRGQPIGFIGRIDKAVAAKLSLREIPAAAELDLAALVAGTQHVPQLRALPRFPAVTRDITFDLVDSTRYEALEALIRKLKLPFLEDVAYVTTYRGKQVEKGKKSVTMTLIFRSPAATLTSEQVETAVQRSIDAAKSELGATLRV